VILVKWRSATGFFLSLHLIGGLCRKSGISHLTEALWAQAVGSSALAFLIFVPIGCQLKIQSWLSRGISLIAFKEQFVTANLKEIYF